LDAANLMMALTFFMSPADPRMLTTMDATLLPLAKNGLTANSLAVGRGRHLQHLYVLAGRGADPGRPARQVAARGSETDFRADARLRQPCRPLCGRDRPSRRGPGKLPPSFHPSRPDQRGVQSGPRAGTRPMTRHAQSHIAAGCLVKSQRYRLQQEHSANRWYRAWGYLLRSFNRCAGDDI